jgi:hypothetical protein
MADDVRQAVVVIHGMGEQKANDFLRGFIDAAIPAPTGDGVRYRSMPDRLSELFELRRLSAPSTRDRPITDFYEYYWAHHMEGGKFEQLLPILRALFLRLPQRVPGSLRFAWALGWAVVLGLAFAVYCAWRTGAVTDLEGAAKLALALGVVGFAGAAIRLFVKTLLTTFAVSYFGDVARYVDRSPQNVKVRQEIRSEAVTLLQKLHEGGQYDRIVVVGHSLGTFIAYDVLSHLYAEMHDKHGAAERPRREELQKLEEAGAELLKSQPVAPTGRDDKRKQCTELLEEYRTRQRSAWLEQRRNGNPWLVTDFISVGSPLTHASILLATQAGDLDKRRRSRELPGAPPDYEKEHFSYPVQYRLNTGEPRTAYVLHHGALFGLLRWTNIWYPSRLGLFGDWFGGPLRDIFGPGVADVAINAGHWTRYLPVVPHTQYFKRADDTSSTLPGSSVRELRRAMDLAGAWLDEIPRSDQQPGSPGHDPHPPAPTK